MYTGLLSNKYKTLTIDCSSAIDKFIAECCRLDAGGFITVEFFKKKLKAYCLNGGVHVSQKFVSGYMRELGFIPKRLYLGKQKLCYIGIMFV